MAKQEFFYISNLITLSRFVILAIAIIFLLNDDNLIAGLFIILIWISDMLDGYVARKRNEVSTLGKIIDPLADKTCIIAICLVMFFKQMIPFWFIIVLILRDLLILTGGFYLRNQTTVVPVSNFIGKVSVFAIGFTLLFILIGNAIKINGNWELISNILIFITLVMVIISLYSYLKKFLELLKIKGS